MLVSPGRENKSADAVGYRGITDVEKIKVKKGGGREERLLILQCRRGLWMLRGIERYAVTSAIPAWGIKLADLWPCNWKVGD